MTETKYGQEQRCPQCGKLNPSGKKLPEECLHCNGWMKMFSPFIREMHMKIETQREVNQLKEENARMREALKQIKHCCKQIGSASPDAAWEIGEIEAIAKQALKGDE